MVKKDPSESLGVIVKKRLIEMNMTQHELAQNIGVSYKYLNSILNGARTGTKYRAAIFQGLGIHDKPARKGAKLIIK